jgi:hypothetical protein
MVALMDRSNRIGKSAFVAGNTHAGRERQRDDIEPANTAGSIAA